MQKYCINIKVWSCFGNMKKDKGTTHEEGMCFLHILAPKLRWCVSQVEVFLTWCDMLMSGDPEKQPKTSICTYTYDGKIAQAERFLCPMWMSPQKQIFSPATSTVLIKQPADCLLLGSVFLVLLATCSTLFPPVMPYLFFSTLCFNLYSFLGMPIHNPSFPLFNHLSGQIIHSLFVFGPAYQLLTRFDHIYFFPHLPLGSDVVLHSVFPH